MRAFGARHEFLSAALFFTVLACAWSWPMLKGDQLTQDYLLYRSVPWQAERPAPLDVTPRSTDGDIATQHYALFGVARDYVRDGHLPLWNPYIFGGLTMVGDMQTAVVSPLTWLGWLLPAGFAWGLIATIKLLIAGFGTYVLARQLRLAPGGALVAGSVYALSAPIILWLQWPLGTVYVLLPWLFWAVDRVYREPSVSRTAGLAVVVALNIVAGHPESALINVAAAGLYLLVLAAIDSRRPQRARLRAVGVWAAGHLVGGLLAAPALLPFLTGVSDSISRLSHIQAGSGLPGWTAITYALPNIFGVHHVTGIKQLITYSSLCMYFGVAALMLALVGAWLYRWSATARAIAVVAVACAAVLFGVPPFNWIFHDVWPFKLIVITRIYVPLALIGAVGAGAAVTAVARKALSLRAIVLFSVGLWAAFAVAALLARVTGVVGASSGLAILTRSSVVQPVARFVLFAALGAVCLWALGRLRRPLAIALVLAVCVIDLGLFQDYNVWLSPALAHPRTPPSLAFLQREPGPFRVSPYAPGDIRQVLPPNTNARFGLESVTGYYYPESERWARLAHDVFRQEGLLEHVVTDPVPRGPALAAMRAFNNRYYLTPPGARSPAPGMRRVYGGRDASVWLDPGAFPRAYVVSATRVVPEKAALAALAAGAFDPRTTALVPPGTRAIHRPPGALRFRPAFTREVARDRVRVNVGPGGPGWLVLANGYTKQWRAKVDGRRVDPRPTNYAAMGVPVGAGRHRVEFYVDEGPFWKGVGLFFFTAVVLSLAVLGDRRRRTGAGWFGRL